MKILISDKLNSEIIPFLKDNGHEVDFNTSLSEKQLIKVIPEYDCLFVRSATKVTSDVINAGVRLKVIGRAGTGVDNIDLAEATLKGILVLNTPGGNTRSAAEHTIAMMLSLFRHIPQANFSMKMKKWDRKSFAGEEFKNKILAIVGLGKIGQEVAEMADGLGMKVIAYDPFLTKESAEILNVSLVSMDKLFELAEIISLHIPLNDQTKNLISSDVFDKCKHGVKIINCARGGIINETDLISALKSGKVGGAAIDVFENEPTQNFELIDHPNVITTPHLGASTKEAQEKVAFQLAEEFVKFCKGNDFIGSVNSAAIKFINIPEAKPIMELAEKLGKFLSQLLTEGIRSITIKAYGTKAVEYFDLIKSAFLKTLMQKYSAENLNLINSIHFAEQKGIKISAAKLKAHPNFSFFIETEIITSNAGIKLGSTIIGASSPRIVGYDDYPVEFELNGKMIIYHNIDEPGILAKVSNILSESNINIAGVSLGRNSKESQARTIIKIDEDLLISLMNKIFDVDGIMNLWKINL